MNGPLQHLRVLDLTIARAGPTAVRLLADWGRWRQNPPYAAVAQPLKERGLSLMGGVCLIQYNRLWMF